MSLSEASAASWFDRLTMRTFFGIDATVTEHDRVTLGLDPRVHPADAM